MRAPALVLSLIAAIGVGLGTSAAHAKPLPFRSNLPMKVFTPKPAPTYIGGATPSVKFNRLSVGGASGVNPALRSRAYKALDRNTSKLFSNRGPVVLPKQAADGRALSYRYVRLRDGKHGGTYSNGRAAVALGKNGAQTGPAYVSRHHGDGGGKVVRIQ